MWSADKCQPARSNAINTMQTIIKYRKLARILKILRMVRTILISKIWFVAIIGQNQLIFYQAPCNHCSNKFFSLIVTSVTKMV